MKSMRHSSPEFEKPIKMEILGTVDCSAFSTEIRAHYKSNILPLLQRLLPNGSQVSLVFLSDPPELEIRRALN